jgi:hypothetical protein
MDKPIDELVAEIDTLIEAQWQHQSDPENLSIALHKLEVKIGMLSPHVAQAEYDVNTAKADYEVDFDKLKLEYMKEKDEKGKAVSATVAESRARIDMADDMLELYAIKKAHTLLKLKREDTQRIVDAARSRLSLIKQDLRN